MLPIAGLNGAISSSQLCPVQKTLVGLGIILSIAFAEETAVARSYQLSVN